MAGYELGAFQADRLAPALRTDELTLEGWDAARALDVGGPAQPEQVAERLSQIESLDPVVAGRAASRPEVAALSPEVVAAVPQPETAVELLDDLARSTPASHVPGQALVGTLFSRFGTAVKAEHRNVFAYLLQGLKERERDEVAAVAITYLDANPQALRTSQSRDSFVEWFLQRVSDKRGEQDPGWFGKLSRVLDAPFQFVTDQIGDLFAAMDSTDSAVRSSLSPGQNLAIMFGLDPSDRYVWDWTSGTVDFLLRLSPADPINLLTGLVGGARHATKVPRLASRADAIRQTRGLGKGPIGVTRRLGYAAFSKSAVEWLETPRGKALMAEIGAEGSPERIVQRFFADGGISAEGAALLAAASPQEVALLFADGMGNAELIGQHRHYRRWKLRGKRQELIDADRELVDGLRYSEVERQGYRETTKIENVPDAESAADFAYPLGFHPRRPGDSRPYYRGADPREELKVGDFLTERMDDAEQFARFGGVKNLRAAGFSVDELKDLPPATDPRFAEAEALAQADQYVVHEVRTKGAGLNVVQIDGEEEAARLFQGDRDEFLAWARERDADLVRGTYGGNPRVFVSSEKGLARLRVTGTSRYHPAPTREVRGIPEPEIRLEKVERPPTRRGPDLLRPHHRQPSVPRGRTGRVQGDRPQTGREQDVLSAARRGWHSGDVGG